MSHPFDPTGPPPPPPPAASGADGEPYPDTHVLCAVLLTLVAPFISLIAALVLRGDEKIAARRQQLTSWAIGSGIWLGIGGLIFIVAVASITRAGTPNGCRGGIDHLEPPSYTSADGTHWTAQLRCMNGGTTTRPAHAAWLTQPPAERQHSANHASPQPQGIQQQLGSTQATRG